jgi:hypothetical protein
MTQATALPVDTTPPPQPAANGKGAGPVEAATEIKIPPRDTTQLERMLKVADERHGQELRLEGQIADKDKLILACEGEIAVKKNELKGLEDAREKLVTELRSVIRGDGATLFDGVGTGAQAIKAGLDAVAKTTQAEADEDQRAFNKATLKEIGIKGTMLDKLEADGIRDGKALQEWMQATPSRKISGVGETAREKINDVMAGWYERRATERIEAKRELIEPNRTETIVKIGARNKLLTIELHAKKIDGSHWPDAYYWSHHIKAGKISAAASIIGPHPTRVEALSEAIAQSRIVLAGGEKVDIKSKEIADSLVKELDKLAKKLTADAAKEDKPRTVGQKNHAEPRDATRGAAVDRAKRELVDEIDARLTLANIYVTSEKVLYTLRLGVICALAGRAVGIKTAYSLGDAQDWLAKLHDMKDEQVKAAAQRGAHDPSN